MAKQTINIGTAANDGTGSSLRAAFDICNDNFTEIYDAATPSGANVTLQGDVTVVGHVSLADSKIIKIGTGDDIQIFHNGSNSFITNFTGNLTITNETNDGDISFKTDDGSGGFTEYFRLDGSAVRNVFLKETLYADNVKARFGSGGDLEISHNGTNTDINNFTGHLNILNAADDSDVIFYTDDGSGGNAEYFRLDGGNTNMVASKTIVYNDTVKASFGNSEDLRIYHSGTNSNIENFTGTLQIIQNLDDGDISFKSDNGSGGTTEYFKLDGSSASSGTVYTNWADDSRITLGAGNDMQLYHDGSNNYVDITLGDLYFTNYADDKDIIFRSDDGSGGIAEYMRIDGSTRSIVVSAAIGMYFNDGVAARFGTGGDLILYHDGTDSYIQNTLSGDLIIENSVNDKDIIFKSDDGSGGSTEYFKLDGSQTIIDVAVRTLFRDNVKATFGAGYDLVVYHDGSNSYIQEQGSGDLRITTSGGAVRINKGVSESIAAFIPDGAVELYHDDSKKFETTSSGATITGSLGIGTSSPSSLLHLESASSPTLRLVDTTNTTILLAYAQNSDAHVGTYSNHSLILDSNSTTALTLDTSQNATFAGNITAKSSGSNADEISLVHSGNTVKIVSLGQSSGHGSLTLRNNSGVETISASTDGTDSTINNGTGDLLIQNTADDKDIILKSDDGSGGTTSYIELDGSDVSTKILTQKVIMSNLPTSDPSNAGQLYNDSGVLKISAG